MLEFFGRFHPVLVHLPIGILLVTCVFLVLSLSPKFANLRPAIAILLFLGAISAVFSCITGYFLAGSGDYDGKLVGYHQWMGIGVAALSVVLLLVHKYAKTDARASTGIAVLLMVLISATGHLGGSLTHGSDYLTAPLKEDGAKARAAIPAIPNIQQALVYQDAIQPLLKNRCYSCHGTEKQKGKLRLDLEAYILKGGEEGNTIIKGKADESELIRRLLLPGSNDKHMPPKEKPQLSQHEIALLHWWINNGARFDKKVKDLHQPDHIKAVLAALEKGTAGIALNKLADIPAKEIDAASDKDIMRLNNAGVMIVPVGQNSNYLTANFINAHSTADSVMDALKAVKDQLVWLKLEHKSVNDATLKAIKNCKNLIRLSLNDTRITDKGLESLKNMDQLQSLSLVGTKVTANGLAQLSKLKSIRVIYLYRTNVQRSDWTALKKLFPKVNIDSGNYQVPTLPKDTTEVKPIMEAK
ncbi:c-type cytochrome domain-containing protein [Pedobacter heparinus]|uniref:c-type cytochrome domain-containing protein n=1 Tax=Pedobacter heparinus TaxID=984 RepID=UPI00292E6A53|nr:c-type cytochrome domain-containing protein [Pedobacter heparinus]